MAGRSSTPARRRSTSRPSEAAAQADEPEWLATLPAGVHQVYEFWKTNLKPGGFGFSARIINYPGGMPGDVGLFFSWPKSALEAIDCAVGSGKVADEQAQRRAKEIRMTGRQRRRADGKLKGKDYERELARLHVELVKLQQWVVHKGLKVCIVFEGRDGAGKGGTIKAITERVSPRVFRVVALPAPTEREKSQMYIQRYIPHLPAAGEIVIFDRSWYNRAGVERVMGFCTEEQAKRFLNGCRRSRRRSSSPASSC